MSTATEKPSTEPARRVPIRVIIIAGLVLSILLAAVISLFASASPDGLEHVAETLGFSESAADSAVADSPLADYGTAGIGNEWLSTAIAGVAGLVITGVVAFGLMRLLARPSGRD